MAVSHSRGTKSRPRATDDVQAPAATRAFEVVEFDGHKMDIRLDVRLIDPTGMEQVLELHRIWIIVALDVFTRAVLGYHIALGMEYNKDDVAAALHSALVPTPPPIYTIQSLQLKPAGGFPSTVIPETAYACWDWFRMNGAKSQLAGDTLTRLHRIVGCWTDNSRGGDPNARPHIERFFHLVARHFAHRLPGTVGSSPESIERALSEPRGNVRLRVELTELEEMTHVLLANYNGTAHGGISGKTPMEAMALSVKSQGGFIRTVPTPLRSNLCLMQEARVVVVKGSTSKGIRPHINFAYVRYTNHALSGNAALIGKKLRIYYDVRDIRAVKAFFEDGTELGILTAARPWNFTPHSLRVRQEIHRLIAERKLRLDPDECPTRAWAKYKWKQARTSTRSCPIHGHMLVDRCPACSRTIPYKLTKAFNQQPFTCPHCGFDMAPTIREDRPKILRLQAHEAALLATPLRFHRVAADAELINATDARHLFKHVAKFGIAAVRHDEVDITLSYTGFLAQVLKDAVPGAKVKRLGGRAQSITKHECGCSHLGEFHDDGDGDEAKDTTWPKTESTVTSDSTECLVRLLDTYKAIRRHLWRHVLKEHQRCIRSAAKSLWWNMHGKSTVRFCPSAMAFLRWRMFWEGCCAPRYLYVASTKDLYGIVGWHLARPETIPSHWSRATRAWVASHVFAASAMDCFGALMRWSDKAGSKADVRWDQPRSPVNYGSLWAVSGRDCSDKPAVVYVRSPPAERRRALTTTSMRSHWQSHQAQIARLAP